MNPVTTARWSTPPPYPRAVPGVVDIWRAELGAAKEDRFSDVLSAQETERAGRIVRQRDRMLWARSRRALRMLLGRYVDRDPGALRFKLGPHGKPALCGAGPHENPRFNLSHSGQLLLVAVTAGRDVGIDIEVARNTTRRPLDGLAIAARVLGAEQVRRLEDLTQEERTREFLRTWTAHEAALKCLGMGLGSAPVVGEGNPGVALWTAELDAGPRAFAALAVAGDEACRLRFWDWRGCAG